MISDPSAAMLSALARWADAHPSAALDLIRIYLGIGLFVRGVLFLATPEAYTSLLAEGSGSPFAAFAVMHYVGLAHAAGGLLLALGLLTRLAALAQLPILIGAAFLVHLPTEGLLSPEFAFAALVGALLAVYAVWGGGPWSVDEASGLWNAREAEDEAALVAAHARELRARPRPSDPAAARPAAPSAALAPCSCGHDRAHPHVQAERSYEGLSGLRFISGTHPRPSAVTFVCRDCGGVVDTVTDPDQLEALRYESTG